MTKLDSILKSRDITFLTNVHLVKAMAFLVVIHGYKSWTIKKTEHWRTDAFQLWCWRRLLRVPWTARIKPVHPKGNQSWIFIGRTDAEAVAPILWPFDGKSPSLEKTLMLGKTKGRSRRGQQRMRWLVGITNSQILLKLMSIESVMPPNHLILCRPLLLLPSIFTSIRVFFNESVLRIFASDSWSIGISALASVLSMNIQD